MSHDTLLSEEQKENLKTSNSSGEHLLALINDVLEVSKIEANRQTYSPVHFDCDRMLVDIELMFRIRTDAKQLQFSVVKDESLPRYVFADQGKRRI